MSEKTPEQKAKAWDDFEALLTTFDALPESEREALFHDIDRRNFETVEKTELERLRGIEARTAALIHFHNDPGKKAVKEWSKEQVLRYIWEGKPESEES